MGYVRESLKRVEITPSNMNCQELFLYRSGVYSVSGGGVLVGQQAVRVLGWGHQDGERFWRVANSWGRDWGEEGTFRIRRGEGRQDGLSVQRSFSRYQRGEDRGVCAGGLAQTSQVSQEKGEKGKEEEEEVKYFV